MGVVYLAEDPRRAFPVAIKLVRPELASDVSYQERFRREIGVAFRVAGPHTARVLAADLDADEPYFVTEFVDGPTLAEHVRVHGPISGPALRDFAAGTASGLMSIHSVGLVHRDLKPSNVVLSESGPKLIDFGIAADPTASSLTRPGERIGTPGWLAPEQARGQEVGTPTDVFAWGALIAFAGTGREPFGRGPAEAALYRVVHEEPDLNGLDQSVRPLVTQALTKEPAGRPTIQQLHRRAVAPLDADTTQAATAADAATTSPMKDASVLPPSPSRHRNGGWAVTAAIALVIATAVTITAIALSRREPSKSRPRTSPSTAATPDASTPATSPGSTAATPLPALPAPSANEIASEMAHTVEVGDPSAHFESVGDPVTTSDGASGTLTAAIGRSPNADGTGQLIFFWHDTTFLGWHSDFETIRFAGLSGSGPGQVTALVTVYGQNDPLCCPTVPPIAITYQWTDGKIVPNAPLPKEASTDRRVRRLQ